MARRTRVFWTEKANEDLEKICRRIRELSSERTAKSFASRIFASVRNLRDFPELGSIAAESRDVILREMYVGAYRVLYQYEPPYVRVVAVRHSAQLLSEDDIAAE
jgi:plasmid stabilization system protein ParE